MEFNGEALRSARKRRDMTIAELGKKSDVSSDTIYRAESGLHVPAAENLARIAAELDISLDDLFVPSTNGEAA